LLYCAMRHNTEGSKCRHEHRCRTLTPRDPFPYVERCPIHRTVLGPDADTEAARSLGIGMPDEGEARSQSESKLSHSKPEREWDRCAERDCSEKSWVKRANDSEAGRLLRP
jgi:hypothetical protein